MAGYRKADGLFTNATTKNDQIVRQREKLEESNNLFQRSSDLGIGSDTSNIFDGFDADKILEAAVSTLNNLDITTNVANGNPDFEGAVSMNSAGAKDGMYDDLSNAKDKPNKKGPNLLIPDLDQVIQGSVAEASDQVSTRFENKGFGWRDNRNEPGTATATIGQYFNKHYSSTGESDLPPVLGESKDLGDDPISYKQP
tara:strand:- start:13027 stop:13620 length:594 start_codon:yes stop_codon:yes gene_type:complete